MIMRPIGVFDSGFGGLTVLHDITNHLPDYDYIYLGDNARTPYGSRSFETVYAYTLQSVKWLVSQNCHMIIIACNTASAKALRTIQRSDWPHINPEGRVLGVIRPLTETVGSLTKNNHVGLFATEGTIRSNSYQIEIKRFFPHLHLSQESCPLWVPLIENNDFDNEGAGYFIQKHCRALLEKDELIDTILLGCTHYPLLLSRIKEYVPSTVVLVDQGQIVAQSLENYLLRHSEIDKILTKNGSRRFYTTEESKHFSTYASLFYGNDITAEKVTYY